MNNILKYLGVFLVIIGALILVAYIAAPNNALLIAALAVEIVGMIAHVIINKKLS